MGSRETKKLATRQGMIDAAARLFAERGVDRTTMDDIARAAGTSRTSVFNYFGYKEMILCEIGARYVAEIAGSVRPRRGGRPASVCSAWSTWWPSSPPGSRSSSAPSCAR